MAIISLCVCKNLLSSKCQNVKISEFQNFLQKQLHFVTDNLQNARATVVLHDLELETKNLKVSNEGFV